MRITIKPLDDRVLVKPDEEEEKTAGGILLPDTAKEKPITGRVIAVGPGKLGEDGERREMTVKVNDRVVFGRYAGTEVTIDGVEHRILREDEVLARLEE